MFGSCVPVPVCKLCGSAANANIKVNVWCVAVAFAAAAAVCTPLGPTTPSSLFLSRLPLLEMSSKKIIKWQAAGERKTKKNAIFWSAVVKLEMPYFEIYFFLHFFPHFYVFC